MEELLLRLLVGGALDALTRGSFLRGPGGGAIAGFIYAAPDDLWRDAVDVRRRLLRAEARASC